jgi:hypothetical protein
LRVRKGGKKVKKILRKKFQVRQNTTHFDCVSLSTRSAFMASSLKASANKSFYI